MKKKIVVIIFCILMLMCLMPMINSNLLLETFEKNDLPFDVRFDIKITNQNNQVIPIHAHRGILPNLLFKYLDIVSFSIYEDEENPEYLYASMTVRDFKFSEYRSCYAMYWTYNGIRYYIGANLHSLGEERNQVCGYWEKEFTIYHNQIIDGEIQESENKIIWVIPKEKIGSPKVGDNLIDLYAASFLIYQKDCGAPIKLNIASDRASPIIGDGYTYMIQL